MNNTLIEQQDQTINPDKLGIFGDYFFRLKVGSMLNKSGISKTKGASPLELFFIVFNLAFIGKNFFEGCHHRSKNQPKSSFTNQPERSKGAPMRLVLLK